jgi:hypothetical protein
MNGCLQLQYPFKGDDKEMNEATIGWMLRILYDKRFNAKMVFK